MEYYKTIFKFLAVGCLSLTLLMGIISAVNMPSIALLLLDIVMGTIVSIGIIILVFHKSDEYIFFATTLKRIIYKRKQCSKEE